VKTEDKGKLLWNVKTRIWCDKGYWGRWNSAAVEAPELNQWNYSVFRSPSPPLLYEGKKVFFIYPVSVNPHQHYSLKSTSYINAEDQFDPPSWVDLQEDTGRRSCRVLTDKCGRKRIWVWIGNLNQ